MIYKIFEFFRNLFLVQKQHAASPVVAEDVTTVTDQSTTEPDVSQVSVDASTTSAVVDQPVVVPPSHSSPVQSNDEDKIGKEYGYYAHTRSRLVNRYGLQLTIDIWNGWSKQIREKNPIVVFVKNTDTGGEIWRVWFAHRVIFVVFKDDMVVTALTPKPMYEILVRKNLKARQQLKNAI